MGVGNIKLSDITKLDMLSRPGMGQASHSLISHTHTQSPDTSPLSPPCASRVKPRGPPHPFDPPHGRALQWQLSSDAEQLHLRHILPLCGARLPTFPSIRLCAGLTLTHCSPPILNSKASPLPAQSQSWLACSKSPYTSPAEHSSGS